MTSVKNSIYAKYTKRIFDFFLSFIAIIILSPLFLILTITGAIAMKGNPFFVQERPGKYEYLLKNKSFRKELIIRWNEIVNDGTVQQWTDAINSQAQKIKLSAELDNARWHNGKNHFEIEVGKLSSWISERVEWLNGAWRIEE